MTAARLAKSGTSGQAGGLLSLRSCSKYYSPTSRFPFRFIRTMHLPIQSDCHAARPRHGTSCVPRPKPKSLWVLIGVSLLNNCARQLTMARSRISSYGRRCHAGMPFSCPPVRSTRSARGSSSQKSNSEATPRFVSSITAGSAPFTSRMQSRPRTLDQPMSRDTRAGSLKNGRCSFPVRTSWLSGSSCRRIPLGASTGSEKLGFSFSAVTPAPNR